MAEPDDNTPQQGEDEFLGREGQPTGERHTPSEEEIKARGRRNIAIALGVVGFAALVYLTTFFRLAESIEAGRMAGQ